MKIRKKDLVVRLCLLLLASCHSYEKHKIKEQSTIDNQLEIVSLFPDEVTELSVGQKLSVEIYYQLGTVQRGQIWTRPYRQGKPAGGYSAHPLISVEKAVAKEGITEGWFSFSTPVQIDEIRVFLRDSDNQRMVKEISYPADFRWTQ